MYNGILNIFKPRGMTSRDVVNVVSRLTKSKAGHTGTLDPEATGVLPICLGRATKISDFIMDSEKEYVAKVVFGTATDTGDAWGKTISQGELVEDKASIERVLPNFIGEIMQVPPMYSALRFRGRKLYEYAREGIVVERKARPITIYGLEVLRWDLPESFIVRVRCSKGTYIRTLCEDIGIALGTVAHMGSLIRTKTSGFVSTESINLAQLENAAENSALDKLVIPIEIALAHMPKTTIDQKAEKLLLNGNPIPLEFVSDHANVPCLTFDHRGKLSGVFQMDEKGEFLRPIKMLLN